MKNVKTTKFSVVIIVLALSMSSIVIPFSLPISEPVAIIFGNSQQEQASVNALKASFPTMKVIKYSETHSFLNILFLMRNVGETIFIGHGSEKGIMYNNKMITWQSLASYIKNLPSDHFYFIACYASSILNYIHSNRVLTFDNIVDGPSLAYFYGAIISENHGLKSLAQNDLQNLFTRSMQIAMNPKLFDSMYVFDELGPTEAVVDFVNLFLIFFSILFTAASVYLSEVDSSAYETAILDFETATTFVSMIRGTFDMGLGVITWNVNLIASGIAAAVGGYSAYLGGLIQRVFGNNIITEGLALAAIGVDIASITQPEVDALKAASFLLLGAAAVQTIVATNNDRNDCDDVPMESPGCGGSTGGGGEGGCVAQNTNILLANGTTKKVQSLKIGDNLDGFDFQTNSIVPVQLTNITFSKTDELLSINNGLLELTPTDQPIFMSNSTYVGWVINPQTLKVGERIFNPTTNTWVSISDLNYIQGNFKIYDIVTSPFNNYIANGFLLDMKYE